MRTIWISLTFLFVFSSLQAQRDDRAHLGLKAGANFSNIRSAGDGEDWGFNTKTGFAGGLFYHIPLGGAFSLQPELLFSEMGAEFDDSTSTILDTKGKLNLNYFSLPLLLKISPSPKFGFFLGPQLSMFSNGKIKYDRSSMDNRKISSSNTANDLDLAVTGGLEFRFTRAFGIYGRYTYGLTDFSDGSIGEAIGGDENIDEFYNDAFQVGLVLGLFSKPKADEPEVIIAPLDSDMDGTPDATDLCPNEAGIAKYNGCPVPDSDGDGLNDEIDKCPALFGTAKYNGCPIPDTDGDSFNDEQDKCPNEPGVLAYSGCPVPDSDGDGIKDDVDKCPNQRGTAAYDGCPIPDSDEDGLKDDTDICPHYPGEAANLGCPEMTIYFSHNEPELTADDKARLDNALVFIKENPKMKLLLEGHASTIGNADYNKKLSLKRAESVKAYFVSKGMDANTITTVGKGEEMPITTGSKNDGDTLSRRVVIKVH